MNSIFQRIPTMGSPFVSGTFLGEVRMQGDNRAFNASSGERETPPNLNCNVEWDAGCPRPKPSRTMVPYIPSSYLRGAQTTRIGGVEYSGAVRRRSR